MTQIIYTLVGADGYLHDFIGDTHAGTAIGRKIQHSPRVWKGTNGHYDVNLGHGGHKATSYDLAGKYYPFHYRVWRSFFLFRHTGMQKYWIEGNPAAVNFESDQWKANVRNAAMGIHTMRATDIPERVLKPPKIPWVYVIAAAVGALGAGMIIAQLVLKR